MASLLMKKVPDLAYMSFQISQEAGSILFAWSVQIKTKSFNLRLLFVNWVANKVVLKTAQKTYLTLIMSQK